MIAVIIQWERQAGYVVEVIGYPTNGLISLKWRRNEKEYWTEAKLTIDMILVLGKKITNAMEVLCQH